MEHADKLSALRAFLESTLAWAAWAAQLRFVGKPERQRQNQSRDCALLERSLIKHSLQQLARDGT